MVSAVILMLSLSSCEGLLDVEVPGRLPADELDDPALIEILVASVQADFECARTEAVALLEEGRAIATEIGMRPLLERVAALQEQARSLPTKAPAYPDGLTQREVEVLRLIAAGKSNQEIAEELFISPHTVIRHVSNIYAKTGSSNRAEAATYANRRGLVS